MPSKRKQDTEPSDADCVKRFKANSGAVKPVRMTRPATSDVNGRNSAPDQTKTNDKGKQVQRDTPIVQNTTAVTEASAPNPSSATGPTTTSDPAQEAAPGPSKPTPTPPPKRPRIRKLAPPRPFPTVPPGRSATSPRSTSSRPSPNDPTCICVTRKTNLGAYIRRCKSAFLEYGAHELRLSAMGAAIPHLTLLVGSLSTPGVLPYGEGEVKVEVYTGSVEVVDEVLSASDSEDEDEPKEEFRTRIKSTMNVIVRVGDASPGPVETKITGKKRRGKKAARNTGDEAEERQRSSSPPQQIVIQEPEQEDMDES